jgi:hypothetical protein
MNSGVTRMVHGKSCPDRTEEKTRRRNRNCLRECEKNREVPRDTVRRRDPP